jgi:hypothetical protein
MNSRFIRTITLATAFVAGVTLTTQAQTWETFIPRPSVAEVGGTQVILDPFSTDAANPALIVASRVGSIVRMDPLDATTYQTTLLDQSLTWVCRMGMDFNPTDLAAYAAGQRPLVTAPPYPRNNPNIWTVRKSSFDPISGDWSAWSDSDNFSLDSKQDAAAFGFTADPTGNLYACGFANNKSGYAQWIVRRKLGSSSSWSTIANVGSKGRATAYGVCYYPGNAARNLSPALLVSGVFNNKWTVQRLEANGTWTTVDTASITGVARNLAFDSDGNLYAVGYRETSLQLGIGWVVRMSTMGGVPGTWQTVLDVSEGYNSAINDVAIDPQGDMWISGYTGTTMDKTTSQNRWTVMRVSPGQSWADAWNARQHPFDGISSTSTARGIATDDAGNVFITGNVGDLTDGISTWVGNRVVVQRLVR